MADYPTPAVPHLLVDARPLTGARNGITRFVEQLVAAWPISTEFKTTLVSNKPIISNAPIPAGINCFHDRHLYSSLPGTLWLTLRAPILARELGATHFLGTQHVLPLWKTNFSKQGLIVHDFVYKLFPQTMTWKNRIISRFFSPRSILHANHIFCVSKSTQADLKLYFGNISERSLVCYPGRTLALSGDSTSKLKTTDHIALLVVGSMEPRKNISSFIEAFLLAVDEDQRLYLDLVSGDSWGGVMSESIWFRVKKHPHIRIHNRISDQALSSLYSNANFLVFPSLYEGFGFPILEAVGHCAVIANDIPIFRELANVIDGVHLINMETAPSLIAQKILSLVTADKNFMAANDHGLFRWEASVQLIVSTLGLQSSLARDE